MLVARLVELVKAHARVGRVHLEVEGGGLYRLLFTGSQMRKTVGECISDAEVHQETI